MVSEASDQPAHPMDNIPIRNLRFDTEKLQGESALWSRSQPDFSMFINALGIHVPYFERFLVAVFRNVRTDIEDADLLLDVKGIIGQEAHHAFNLVRWNEVMSANYPRIGELEADADKHFSDMLAERSRFFRVGYVAGYETFTFLAGAIILDRYEETLRAYLHMGRVEGFWRQPARGIKAAKFFARFAADLALSALKHSYHPRSHPICNNQQNKIALAWRERYDAGLTTLAIAQGDLTAALYSTAGDPGK